MRVSLATEELRPSPSLNRSPSLESIFFLFDFEEYLGGTTRFKMKKKTENNGPSYFIHLLG